MAYQNFMCNKDFHPSSYKNIKKVRQVKYKSHETSLIWPIGMGGRAEGENGSSKTRGTETAVFERAGDF